MDDPGPVLLIHGGLYEDDMKSERFWRIPGVTDALERRRLEVVAVDRPHAPASWAEEVAALDDILPCGESFNVVAGSNGCSVAVRLALDAPHRVRRLVLCWPATSQLGDHEFGLRERIEATHGVGAAEALLEGDTIRGVLNDELRRLDTPAAIVPSAPENIFHLRRTVDSLLEVVPGAVELTGFPEPPRPEFAGQADPFADVVVCELTDRR